MEITLEASCTVSPLLLACSCCGSLDRKCVKFFARILGGFIELVGQTMSLFKTWTVQNLNFKLSSRQSVSPESEIQISDLSLPENLTLKKFLFGCLRGTTERLKREKMDFSELFLGVTQNFRIGTNLRNTFVRVFTKRILEEYSDILNLNELSNCHVRCSSKSTETNHLKNFKLKSV